MERTKGSAGIPVVECINPRLQKYRIRYDIRDDGEGGVTFLEREFLHKPSMDEVKEAVIAGYNAEIDEKIKSGYAYDGVPVWLSTENQFNYKAAYDLAVQTSGASLPVTFKLGTDAEPVYREFTALDDLAAFYKGALKFIGDTLAEGWAFKDAIDWTEYERLLDGDDK